MSADLDREIDRAVREMLDVEPPPGLRGRVMDRLESIERPAASRFGRTIWWTAAPLAAAALMVLAVLLPRHESTTRVAPAPAPSIARANPPSTPPAATPAPRLPEQPGTEPIAAGAVDLARERQTVTAAVAADEAPVPGFPRVPSLTVPQLSVSEIKTVAAVAPPAELGVEPIAVPAPIDVEPLPLSPRERQSQE
jgi:hypothetical protein